MLLSGPIWVSQFPTSRSIDSLVEPFRHHVRQFVAALQTAGAKVDIRATFRPSERAYLMHYCYCIAREGLDPRSIPPMRGVDIQWVHKDAHCNYLPEASKLAAVQMVQKYDIVHKPVLHSRHTEGRAIDMTISWIGALQIRDGLNRMITISTSPSDGAHNSLLHSVGATYHVHKLLHDPPHWSSDGH